MPKLTKAEKLAAADDGFDAPATPRRFPKDLPAGTKLTLREADEAVYGAYINPMPDNMGIPRTQPIQIMRPDLRQPRRAVPAQVRADWKGDPAAVPLLLERWQVLVERKLDKKLAIKALLDAEGDVAEAESEDERKRAEDPLVQDFLELVKLAASIRREGLINPIRVVNSTRGASRFLIESGERRWLAYHLLRLYVSPGYNTIPAFVSDHVDVWAQAAENGQRRPLNAIGMARQIALLVMDMYPDQKWHELEDLIKEGESEQLFYAQVADGNEFRIQRGYGKRVLEVTGLPSLRMVQRHRALLRATRELWERADSENLPEGTLRELMNPSDTRPNGRVSDAANGVKDDPAPAPSVPKPPPPENGNTDNADTPSASNGVGEGRHKPKTNRTHDDEDDDLDDDEVTLTEKEVGAKFDRCQTPYYGLVPLAPYLQSHWTVWEPAAGIGRLVRALEGVVQRVIATDILTGQNFLEPAASVPMGVNCLVTNPPYSIKYDWLRRCYYLWITYGIPFALLLPGETLFTEGGQKEFDRYDLELITFYPRIDFDMPVAHFEGGGAQFPTAWFCCGLNIGRPITSVNIKAEKAEFKRRLAAKEIT